MSEIRALSVNIFKGKVIFKDCSNGGISSRHDSAYIVCDDGNYVFDSDNLPENLLIIAKRGGYEYARPYEEPNNVGWMFGGTLVYTSDSRFPSRHPLCLHDRQETWEEYRVLSQ